MNVMLKNPIEYFRLKSTETESRTSSGNMARAVDSIARFAGGVDFSFDNMDAAFLGEWVARQFFDGYYAKTVAYNVSKIAALYNKAVAAGVAARTDAFSEVLAKIKGVADRFDGLNHSDIFQRLRAAFRSDSSAGGCLQLAKDMTLFGILNGGMSLEQIAACKKDDFAGADKAVSEIVEKYAKPKNKYLFPLNQSKKTRGQVKRAMETLIGSFLKQSGLRSKNIGDNVLVDLWCDLAMCCGVSASDISACVDGNASSSALTFCAVPSKIDGEEVARIRRQVGEALVDNPVRWYAMHLRRSANFKELTDRIKEKGVGVEEIFYPMEEIISKVGKKKVFESRPVISWLVFYRARVTQLNKIFHEIGDLAWGYRYVRDVKSPYAAISDREVREYQQAIGALGPDTQMMADDEVKFEKGDYLVLLGAPMHGRHGVFVAERKEKGDASGRVVFRVELTGGKNACWEVNWDPRLVKKITEGQYRELERQFNDSTPAQHA